MSAEVVARRRQRLKNPYSVLPDWVYPTFVFLGLSLFGLYVLWLVVFNRHGYIAPYLSPFYSPQIFPSGPIPPALWVMWAPFSFRATCYYYRKAYFRGFFWHPRSCAHDEPTRGTYHGETRFWIFNNFHRFAFYVTVVQLGFVWYDVTQAFSFRGHPGIGLGTAIMLINVVLLSGYTFGCHAWRHLIGGSQDCFSCSRTTRLRHQIWRGVSVLNVAHDRWAWASLFSVLATDVYLRLLMSGVIHDPRLLF